MTDTGKLMYQSCRENASLSQSEACYHLDIKDVSQLSRYENGRVTPPDAVVREMSILYKDKNLIIWHLRRIHPFLSDCIPYPASVTNINEALTKLAFSMDIIGEIYQSAKEFAKSPLTEGEKAAFKETETEKAADLINKIAAYKMFLEQKI